MTLLPYPTIVQITHTSGGLTAVIFHGFINMVDTTSAIGRVVEGMPSGEQEAIMPRFQQEQRWSLEILSENPITAQADTAVQKCTDFAQFIRENPQEDQNYTLVWNFYDDGVTQYSQTHVGKISSFDFTPNSGEYSSKIGCGFTFFRDDVV